MGGVPAGVSIGGILFPPFLFMCFYGFLTALLITWVLSHYGLGRFIWYPPLFFLALTVLFSSIYALVL